MNRKQKIIVSITGIFIVLLALVGLTYAYFLTQIKGNSNPTSITVSTANLILEYGDGNGVLSPAGYLVPGSPVKFLDASGNTVTSKTFTVENKGNSDISNYAVTLENFSLSYIETGKNSKGVDVTAGEETTLAFPETMRISLACTSNKGTCNGLDNGMFPEDNAILLYNDIKIGEKQEYTLTMEYIDNGEDQSEDMNKTLSAKINIIDANNTIDLTGEVDSSLVEHGDIAQINSEPKTSRLLYDKEKNVYTYKIVGVKPDEHTLGIYNDQSSAKGTSELSIVKGTEASVVGNTITFTDESRIVNVNIIDNYSNEISTNIREKIPYVYGTLAYKILENAQTVTEEEKVKLYAEFSDPKTTVAESISAADESVLANAPEGEGTTYYFRGNVKNNYVNFNGMCWRIVRTEADGSVRLIMEDSVAECNETPEIGYLDYYTGHWNVCTDNVSEHWFSNHANFRNCNYGITSLESGEMMRQFNSFEKAMFTNGESYVYNGLKIKPIKLCLNNKHGYDTTGSQISDELMEEYLQNVGQDHFPERAFNYQNSLRYYGIGQNLSATFDCPADGLSEQSYRVFPITADEIIYAGGKINKANQNFYFVNGNSNFEYGVFNTQSLSSFDGYFNQSIVMENNGLLRTNATDGPEYARPAISLISSVEYKSGNGSIENPYVIR